MAEEIVRLPDGKKAYILDLLREGRDLTKIGIAHENYTFFYIVDAQALESDLWRQQGKLALEADATTKYWDLREDLHVAWQRLAACQWLAVQEAQRAGSVGPGQWAVVTIEMTAVGVAHFVSMQQLSSNFDGCWQLKCDLLSECVDFSGRSLYSCTWERAHFPETRPRWD